MKHHLFTLLLHFVFFSCSLVGQEVQDIDNNSYSLLAMGEHLWTTSNLKVTHFRNGEAIPQAQGAAEWLKASKLKSPAWCYYEDAQGIDQTTIFYNWYAVNDPRGLAPDGTHIPSINEWTNLINTIGGIQKSARVFKAHEGWIKPQATLTHPYNLFNVLPVGSRYSYLQASFDWEIGPSKGRYTNFWTSSSGQYGIYGDHANRIGLSYDRDEVINDAKNKTQFNNSDLNLKGNGYSVRCIKDPLP